MTPPKGSSQAARLLQSMPPWRAMPRRAGWLALVLGVLSACGFQPLDWWPVALLAIGLFALLIPLSSSWKQAAWLGWLLGMGNFTLGNAWIATAFTWQSNMPAVLGWAAVPLTSVYLAIYPAIAAGGAWLLTRHRGGTAAMLGFAGCWIIAEWLRSWVFSGYAWNPFGIVLLGPLDRPGLAALAPYMGTYALSGLAVLLGAALVQQLIRRRWLPAALAFALIAAGIYWPAGEGVRGSLPVTLVQPGIMQGQVNDPLFYESNFTRLAQLSPPREPGFARLVLWPESGMADYLERGYPQVYYNRTTALGSPDVARARIARSIGPGALLLTGGQFLLFDDGQLTGATNSVLAVTDTGEIADSYSKAHLVPFGEYLPLRALLEPIGISRLVPGGIDFKPGPGPRTLDLGAYGKAGVQICYEIVFSGQVTDRADRPDYIFNPSNDGWFGVAGPPQHLAQARLRAAEEGLPVLRATTSGISAIIDARGVVRQWLPTGAMARIDTVVPPASPPTLFARLGNILALLWAVVFLLPGFVVMQKPRG